MMILDDYDLGAPDGLELESKEIDTPACCLFKRQNANV